MLQLYLPRWQAAAAPDDPVHGMEVTDLLDDLRLIEQTHLAVWAERAERQREERERKG